jgi:hypothetical protein
MDITNPVMLQDAILEKAFCSTLTIRRIITIGSLIRPCSTTRGTSTRSNSLDEYKRIHTNNSHLNICQRLPRAISNLRPSERT